ncbi:AbgT family transporter [bacterium]|nr:AbgT family transporter [bacterium]RQV98464.1 MAG: AbgT family transporter [bacterium]
MKIKFNWKKITSGFLTLVEKGGNALPHPATLFGLFALLVIVISWIASKQNWTAMHPATGELIHPVNLISIRGLHRILNEMVTNYTSFAPLGIVMVSILGIGMAESSGLIGTALRLMVISAPKRLLTFIIVLTGVLSNTASEIGYVLLIPLGGMIFLAVGRHPIAGLAAAFAGVSGGYSANLLLGTIDPILAGLSQEAANIIMPGYIVNPAANYYFMFVSTFFIAIAGTWVTEKIVIPRLGDYAGDEKPEELKKLNRYEKRGLLYTVIVGILFVGFILAGIMPANGYLRDLETGGILHSPLLTGIVAFLFLGSLLMSVAYGIGAGVFKNDKDVIKGMSKAISTLSIYLVLAFFAAQFVSYFKWTNLGLIFAIEGANILKSLELGSIPLMIAFILLSAMINMFMGSASAKWALIAPIFIPMFMLLGYTPELVQVAYRIGDSTTNIISPMMSYFALIIAFMERYDKKAGMGTVIATMLPYTVVFLAVWIILFSIWVLIGLPVGPNANLFLNM